MGFRTGIRKAKATARLVLRRSGLGASSLVGLAANRSALRVNSYGMWNKDPWSFRGTWFYQFVEHVSGRPLSLNSLRQDVSFYSVFGGRDFSRGGGKKVFFTGENVHSEEKPKYRVFEDHCLDDVDLAIGFDEMEYSKYVRFPLWILYFFKPQSTKDDVVSVVDAFNAARYEKTRFCSLVARKDFNGIRKSIFDAVGTISPIDSAGALFHNDDRLVTEFGNEKIEYLKQYRFNICPENSLYPGYVTEKLFESLHAGCVPIYWGPSAIEGGIVNPNWFIRWDENDPAPPMKRISELHASQEEYEALVKEPKLLEGAADYVWKHFEKLTGKVLEILD